MSSAEIRAKLHSGERVYGTMVVAFSPRWPAAIKAIGLDFAFIDTEHPQHDRTELSYMCQLYAASGITPIVRIPSPDPYQAAMVLDGGAQGVIAPYVETVEQVRQIVGAVKYRPLKGDVLHKALTGERPLEPAVVDYLAQRNANNICIINIESQPALDALDDILAVDGVDALLVGPHDLSVNLGVPEQYEHPKFVAAIDMIVQKARARNVGAGTHVAYANGMEQEVRWAKMGANLIVHSMDITAFRNGLRQEFDAIKAALSEQQPAGAMEAINL